jgi:DNA repair exonuclease SbcCD ATPase subunit
MNGDSTEKGAKKSAEKLVGLDRAIEVHEARIQKFKDLIAGDSNLTEEQIEEIEAKITQAENNTEHLKDVQEAKREKLKTKLMAVGNLSEDEAEEELEELEEEQNLSEVKRLIAEKRLSEFEEHLEDFKEKVYEAQAEGKNVTFAQVRILELERIAQEANELIQQGEYDEAMDKLKEFGESKKELEKQNRKQNREKNKHVEKFNGSSAKD